MRTCLAGRVVVASRHESADVEGWHRIRQRGVERGRNSPGWTDRNMYEPPCPKMNSRVPTWTPCSTLRAGPSHLVAQVVAHLELARLVGPDRPFPLMRIDQRIDLLRRHLPCYLSLLPSNGGLVKSSSRLIAGRPHLK